MPRSPPEYDVTTLALPTGDAEAGRRRHRERREQERQIEQQKALLENTLESLTHPFYVIDTATYEIKVANSAARASSARAPTRVTRQPRRPHRQGPPWGLMAMWPISPATPVAPR